MRSSRALFLVAALFTASACEAAQEALAPSPEEVATAFVEAWNAEDYEAVNDLLYPRGPHRETWHSGAIRYAFGRVLKDAEADGFEVALGERIEGTSTFDYSITYDSQATRQPVTLEDGRLKLIQLEDDWYLEWSERLPFAGHYQAKAFDVEERWGRRGIIRDRSGRTLASGGDAFRKYPAGSVGGIVVGHLAPAPKRSGAGRLVGASGVEEAFDDRLAGIPSRRLVLVGRDDEVVRRFAWIYGRDGKRVRLSLDLDVQRAAQNAFGSTVGGAVVLDPSTGDVLAAVSSSFDPGSYVGAENVEPFDRALSGLYPPGSSLKVLTASAALDTGEVKPTTMLTGPKEYRGVRNFESGEFGTISFASAMQNSVNTSFAQVALRLGSKRLHRYAERFGFNRAPAMQLDAGTSSFPLPADEGDLMWGSIGQAQVLASPLQMATVAATVANDGRRMEPRIDMSVEPTGERAIKVKTARTMQELMRSVVTGGTGVAANVSGLEVAGKTGTAEVDVGGERKNHAWFICFAPASDPKVAIAVVSEYGGVGGQVAAPLARSILTSVWPHLPSR